MPERAVTLRGTALHSGAAAEVKIARVDDGPITWAQGGVEARLDELRPARTDRGLRVEGPERSGARASIDSVEHLLAAIGGLGVREGIRIEASGAELPLLDGGARLFCEALFAIGARCGRRSSLVIAKRATFQHGASTYTLTPPPERASLESASLESASLESASLESASLESASLEGTGARLVVDVTFPSPVGHERAEWSGDPADFFARIAPSRTFGWASEHSALLAQNRAAGVDLKSVIVFGPDAPIAGCRPNAPGEIARHKLLDLAGDLALYGGPPVGSIEAIAPGHTATHAVVAEALASGALIRIEAHS